MKFLITYQQGSISSCAKHLDRKPTRVIHENIVNLDLRNYNIDNENKDKIRKRYPKQADEVFLCKSCWDIDYYNNDLRYEKYLGQADFTSLYLRDWIKKDYKLITDVVDKYR